MYKIKVQTNNKTKDIILKDGESLMNALIRENFYVSAICAGKGRCGKCKVRVIDGVAPISAEDTQFFTETELADGMRLSCTLYPNSNMTIEFNQNDESTFEIISDYQTDKTIQTHTDNSNEYEIAIDIGTTTIVFQLIDKSSKRVCHTTSKINRQRQYGADVVSRIQSSISGNGELLRDSIRSDLKIGIHLLCSEYRIDLKRISKIVIAANTTMTHLLMGYDCSGLGVYPFTPVNIDFIKGRAIDIIGISSTAEVVILPAVSTYVGGDIVSGLYECGFDKTDDICLLIDLGTNGEMALGNRSKILVASTAAGPAFEGGNITCGTGSVSGAVCSVKLNGESADIKTISDKPPVGICGTGCIEITAELIREKLVDNTGLLNEKYFDKGFPIAKSADGQPIRFTQKDIRELQLAKAAIRAGAETLILRCGITKEQISKVYIAGGFGYRLDAQKAAIIGMLPPDLVNRVQAVGNSSLGGAVKYLTESDSEISLQNIVNISEEISLALDSDFSEIYMRSMMFSEK